MLSLDVVVSLVLLGSAVGFVAGLFGIGGGGIFVPVLTALFISLGYSSQYVVHLALGTSMTTIVATSLSSMLAHRRNRNVDWQAVKAMVPVIILAAFLTTFIVSYVNTLSLSLFFTAFMAFVSFKMFKGGKASARQTQKQPAQIIPAAGIGIVSTLVAIGGGSLSVPYLVSRGFDIKKAIGTSAAIGFPLALAGSLGYLLNGDSNTLSAQQSSWIVGFVHLPSVLILSVCGFLTAPLGANMAQKLPIAILKKLFAVLLMLLSIKMLLTIW